MVGFYLNCGRGFLLSVFNLNNAAINRRMERFDRNHINNLTKAVNFMFYPLLGIIIHSSLVITIGLFLTFFPFGLYYLLKFLHKLHGIGRIYITGKILFISYLVTMVWLLVLFMDYLTILISTFFMVAAQTVVLQIFAIFLVCVTMFNLFWSETIYPKLLERSNITIDSHFHSINKNSTEFSLNVILIPSLLVDLFLRIAANGEIWVILQILFMCILSIIISIYYEPVRHSGKFASFVLAPSFLAILLAFQSDSVYLTIGPILILGSLLSLIVWNPKSVTRNDIRNRVEEDQQEASEFIRKDRILRQTRPIGYFIVNRILPPILVISGILLTIPLFYGSMISGALMFIIGALYLAIEQRFSRQ